MIAEFLAGLVRFNLALAAALAVVMMLRRPARRWLGAQAAYRLWLAAPLAALAVLAPARQVTTAAPVPVRPTIAAQAGAPTPPPVAPAAQLAARPLPAAPTPLRADELEFGFWLAGAAFAAGLLAYRQRRFLAALGELRPVDGEAGVWRAASGAGPAVVGAARPRIVLPADFGERFAPEERDVVLAHERAHLARLDAQVNGLLALAQCLNWFNPVLHLAARRLRLDQELACDAAVIERLPGQRRRYAEALLKSQIDMRPLPLGCHWPARAGHPLEERIAMLKQSAPSASRRTVGLAATLAVGLSLSVAAWASQPPQLIPAPPAPIAAAAPSHVAPPAAPAPPQAADPAVGDWVGALKSPDLRIALHVRPAPSGGDQATLDSPDQGAFDLPTASVTSQDGKLALELPKLKASYAAHWDPASGRWLGTWTQVGKTWELDLSPGTYPPLPKIAGLDGQWSGKLQGTALRLNVRVFTDEHGTRGSLDSPDQGAFGIPLSSISRDGGHVSFGVKALNVTMEGDLGADGQTINATFIQNGASLPITLTRGGPDAAGAAAIRPTAPAQTADLSGTWVFEGVLEAQGQVAGVFKPLCVFQQAGDKLVGSCKGPAALGVASGTVDGQKVSWRWDWADYTSNTAREGIASFDGSLGADSVIRGSLTSSNEPGVSGTFSGRRQ
jgi:beta-lactamase regulating signal transducer with metallopeptidase domain